MGTIFLTKFSARRAVIVSKPQASAWGQAKDSAASERRFVNVFLHKILNIKLSIRAFLG